MDCVGIILTRAMRSWTPVSDPPWIRKPHGSPPSRITWRLLLLLLVLLVGVSIILERLVALLIGGSSWHCGGNLTTWPDEQKEKENKRFWDECLFFWLSSFPRQQRVLYIISSITISRRLISSSFTILPIGPAQRPRMCVTRVRDALLFFHQRSPSCGIHFLSATNFQCRQL
jgi:hypothetical protein